MDGRGKEGVSEARETTDLLDSRKAVLFCYPKSNY